MSDSNWRRSYTIGLIASGLVAIGFASWLWSSTEEAHFAIEQQATKGAEAYTDPRNIAIEGKCAAIAPTRGSDCITDEREASNEGQRKERDLEAQRVVAAWTRAIGIATIVGMTFGIFGLGLIFVTFRETRRAANAGLQANEIALNAQKAWVTLSAVPMLSRPDHLGTYFRFNVIAENVGQSAATHFGARTSILFQCENETDAAFQERIAAKVQKWRSANKSEIFHILAPREKDIGPFWESKYPPELVAKSIHNAPFCEPILVAAAFYRTVSKPDSLQIAWRAWSVGSIENSGESFSMLRMNKSFGPDHLHIIPFIGMRHEEHPTNDDTRHHEGD